MKRLAAALEAVRERLGVTQEEFAALCGLAKPTIQRVIAAKVEPRAKTYKGLDQGAGWPAGTARAIVEQGILPPTVDGARPAGAPHEFTAIERNAMRVMPWSQVWETYEMFRLRSEDVAQKWLAAATQEKAATETPEHTTPSTTER